MIRLIISVKAVKKLITKAELKKRVKKLYNEVNLEDYTVVYKDKSTEYINQLQMAERQKEQGFAALKKVTLKDKELNCPACGFGTCDNAAKAIVLGQNVPESCREYAKKIAREEHEEAVTAKLHAQESAKKSEEIAIHLKDYASHLQEKVRGIEIVLMKFQKVLATILKWVQQLSILQGKPIYLH